MGNGGSKRLLRLRGDRRGLDECDPYKPDRWLVDLEIDHQSSNQFEIHIEVVVDRASWYDNDLCIDHRCACVWIVENQPPPDFFG